MQSTQQPRSKKTQVPRADWSRPAPASALSPVQAAARLRLIRQAEQDTRRFVFGFSVQHDHGPAFRSLIDEMGALLAGRFGGKNSAQQEKALAQAAVALGELRAAVFAQVTQEDENFVPAHE